MLFSSSRYVIFRLFSASTCVLFVNQHCVCLVCVLPDVFASSFLLPTCVIPPVSPSVSLCLLLECFSSCGFLIASLPRVFPDLNFAFGSTSFFWCMLFFIFGFAAFRLVVFTLCFLILPTTHVFLHLSPHRFSNWNSWFLVTPLSSLNHVMLDFTEVDKSLC